jgi:UDP-N-acetylglucosamine 1-carboxyvinyltransferase
MHGCYFAVNGGIPLVGCLAVAGAMNAVLVQLCSLVLHPGVHQLHNVPNLADVHSLIDLLTVLGCSIAWSDDRTSLTVDTGASSVQPLPASIFQSLRASVLLLGPLLGRFGIAEIAYPGGCPIGARPIDFHLKAFERMGAQIEVDGEVLRVSAPHGLRAARIVLEYPSVGATENFLLAAVLTQGRSTIVNAAIEPEVEDLITLLRSMGAVITVQAPATITVEGGLHLREIVHTVLPDRLEAGTYLAAAAMTRGSVCVSNISASLLEVFLAKLEEMGHTVTASQGEISVAGVANPKAVSFTTMPYPGFPTDLQAVMSVLQICASGTSKIHETVFENRLVHLAEINKMGAKTSVLGDRAVIEGVSLSALQPAKLVGTDIRGTAGLLIAALGVGGISHVYGVGHIRRGYSDFEQTLQGLGAQIQYIQD